MTPHGRQQKIVARMLTTYRAVDFRICNAAKLDEKWLAPPKFLYLHKVDYTEFAYFLLRVDNFSAGYF